LLSRLKRGFAPPVAQWHKALFAAHGESLRGGHLVQSRVLKQEGADPLVLEQWCRQMSAESCNANVLRETGQACVEHV
jgi:hypothetical protein